ncbi:MAG TPA: PIN domain-containing protein [Thermoanaerobaculia bacterium]|nr:PIN domain-containing protein [Thermoanaerobaculia bacterium]
MVALLDLNVLIALAWPNHVHHEPALAWFRRHQGAGWATCPATEAGFVRVSSNRQVMPAARTPAEAIQLLRRIRALPGHEFWADDISLATSEWVDPLRLIGHRQVSDAHLLALALKNGGRLATLDRGIRQLVPPGYSPQEVVALLVEAGG